ncbi:MAG: BatD family protein [Bradymonadales bacterium]|nr:BatD family protein [Bradymonadales bacterium]
MRRVVPIGLLLLVVTGFVARQASAQNAELTASVDRQQLALDQMVTLTVTAEVQDGRGPIAVGVSDRICQSTLSNSGDCDFLVTGSWQSQSSTIWGRTSQTTITMVYELRPLRTGNLTIWGTLNLGGALHTTEHMTIQVSEPPGGGAVPATPAQPATPPAAGAQPSAPRAAPPPPPSGPTSAPPHPTATASPPAGDGQPTASGVGRAPGTVLPAQVDPNRPFLGVTPSRETVYVGEQLSVDYELFSSYFENWDLTGLRQPAYEDFWFEAVDPSRIGSYRTQRADVSGHPFRSNLAARFVLVPLSPGRHEIAPLEVEAAELFRGRVTGITSAVATIEVLPLPEGAPAGFSTSNVGQVDFTVDVQEGGRRVGDPIHIRMRVEGIGLVSLFQLPEPSIPGARIQPPVEDRSLALRSDNRIGGTKEVEYVVFATEEGELTIPAITLHYFDPSLRQYRSIERPGRRIAISGVNPNAELVLASQEENGSILLGALPPPRGVTSGPTDPVRIPSTLLWGLLAAPPILYLFVLGIGWTLRYRARTAPIRLKRTAARRARVAVRHAARRQSGQEVLGQVASAVRQYLRERMEIKAGALTVEEMAAALRSRGVPRALAEEVCDLLQTSEMARFDQGGVDRRAAQGIAERARTLLGQLEARA